MPGLGPSKFLTANIVMVVLTMQRNFVPPCHSAFQGRRNVTQQLNVTDFVGKMQNCTLEFVSHGDRAIVDYSTITVPFRLQTFDQESNDKAGTTVNKVKSSCSFRIISNLNMTFGELEDYLQDSITGSPDAGNLVDIIFTPKSNERSIHNFVGNFSNSSLSDVSSSNYTERYYFVIDQQSNKLEFKKGVYKCTVCQAGSEVIENISCSNGSNCFDGMITTKKTASKNGSTVAWDTPDIASSLLDFKLKKEVSKGRKYFFDLEDTKWESVAHFLTDSWNISAARAVAKNIKISVVRKQNPFFGTTTYWHPTDSGMRLSAFVLGRKQGFKFITSDSVKALNSRFDNLTNPIDNSTWLALVGISILISFLLAGIISLEHPVKWKNVMEAFTKTMIWMAGVCLEQCHQTGPINPQNSRIRCVIKIMFAQWLLIAILISNGYKSNLKASLATVIPTTAKWERMEQVSNFTIFQVFEKGVECEEFVSGEVGGWRNILVKKYPAKMNLLPEVHDPCKCHYEKKSGGAGTFAWKRREQLCRFKMEMYEINRYTKRLYQMLEEQQINAGELHEAIQGKSVSLFSHGFYEIIFFLKKDLETVVQTNLNSTKTAFITDEGLVKRYLEKFNDISKKNHLWDLNWHSNKDSKDETLTSTEFLYVSDLNDPNMQAVPNRVRILLQSGIYWLWDRWHSHDFYRSRELGNTKPFPKPLGLLESDLYSVFVILLLGSGVAAIALVLEMAAFLVCLML